jgi:hypothetical protein
MIIKNTHYYQKQQAAILKRIAKLGPFIQGSVVEIERPCGYSGCRCANGGPGHVGTFLTYKLDAKTKTLYIPKDLIEQVRGWSESNKQLKAFIAQMDDLGHKLISRYIKEKRGKAKQKKKQDKSK